MAVHMTKNMTTGKKQAARARSKGFKASVFRVKGGKARVSVTRIK